MTRTLNVNLDKSCFERPLLTYVSELPQVDEAIKDTIYAVTTTGKWYIIDSNKTFVEVNTGSGTTTMYDDSAGGTWNYTYNRHKAQSIEIRYLTAGTLLRPFVYIDSNSGTLQYVTMSVFKLNEK